MDSIFSASKAPADTSLPTLVLLLGSDTGGELAESVRWLDARTRLVSSQTAAEAVELFRSLPDPQIIVLAQRRPGLICDHDVNVLHRRFPLARFAALLGGWCEGETRTGEPWPGVVRIYWHQWIGRAEAERWQERPAPGRLTLPRTATPMEQFLASPVIDGSDVAGKTVGILASTFASYDGLADVCRQLDASPVWINQCTSQPAAAIDLLVIDHDGLELNESDILERCAEMKCPMVVLAHFPRQADVDRWHTWGASTVLAKPVCLEEMIAHWRLLLQSRGNIPQQPHQAAVARNAVRVA